MTRAPSELSFQHNHAKRTTVLLPSPPERGRAGGGVGTTPMPTIPTVLFILLSVAGNAFAQDSAETDRVSRDLLFGGRAVLQTNPLQATAAMLLGTRHHRVDGVAIDLVMFLASTTVITENLRAVVNEPGAVGFGSSMKGSLATDSTELAALFEAELGASLTRWRTGGDREGMDPHTIPIYWSSATGGLAMNLDGGSQAEPFRLSVSAGVAMRAVIDYTSEAGDSSVASALGTSSSFFLSPQLDIAFDANFLKLAGRLTFFDFDEPILGVSAPRFSLHYQITTSLLKL